MKYCQKCGQQLENNATYCNRCGSTAEGGENPYDSGSIGWGLLGFFIPLVGLILYLNWKDSRPKNAKRAGTGALIGFILASTSSFIWAFL
ncbi:MAG: zinc-ribbon domain-containing protein [Candidatus Moranbacteria bacterium]|nr:zinc-ribbon domain-containing protein [Candidatus Moranbacteria bacterium]